MANRAGRPLRGLASDHRARRCRLKCERPNGVPSPASDSTAPLHFSINVTVPGRVRTAVSTAVSSGVAVRHLIFGRPVLPILIAQFLAALFGCGVDLDLVEGLGGQFLFAAADNASA